MRVKRKTFTTYELSEISPNERQYWPGWPAPRVVDGAPNQFDVIAWIANKKWSQIIKLILQACIWLFIGIMMFIFAVVMWP